MGLTGHCPQRLHMAADLPKMGTMTYFAPVPAASPHLDPYKTPTPGIDEAAPQFVGCRCCIWRGRRGFVQLLAASSTLALTPAALAQVDVGKSSIMRHLVSARELEQAGQQQFAQILQQARARNALVGEADAQMRRLRQIALRLIPHAAPWNERARKWQWAVALIRSDTVNAFCLPGGKIAFYTGILQQLRLSDDETAMIMGHEMAHALREHSREQIAKSVATGLGLSLGAQLLGLGDVGNLAAHIGSKLLDLKFSRSDETDADLVGLEIAARAGYAPQAAVSLWQKMAKATGDSGFAFLSTHPSSPQRIAQLQGNVPKVQQLYEDARSSLPAPAAASSLSSPLPRRILDVGKQIGNF